MGDKNERSKAPTQRSAACDAGCGPVASLLPRSLTARSKPRRAPNKRPEITPRRSPEIPPAASGRRSGEPLDLGVVDDEAEDGLAHVLRLRAPHGECRSPAALSAAAAFSSFLTILSVSAAAASSSFAFCSSAAGSLSAAATAAGPPSAATRFSLFASTCRNKTNFLAT